MGAEERPTSPGQQKMRTRMYTLACAALLLTSLSLSTAFVSHPLAVKNLLPMKSRKLRLAATKMILVGGQDGKRQKSGMSLDFLRKESLFSLSDEDLGDQIFNAASRFNVEARAAVENALKKEVVAPAPTMKATSDSPAGAAPAKLGLNMVMSRQVTKCFFSEKDFFFLTNNPRHIVQWQERVPCSGCCGSCGMA